MGDPGLPWLGTQGAPAGAWEDLLAEPDLPFEARVRVVFGAPGGRRSGGVDVAPGAALAEALTRRFGRAPSWPATVIEDGERRWVVAEGDAGDPWVGPSGPTRLAAAILAFAVDLVWWPYDVAASEADAEAVLARHLGPLWGAPEPDAPTSTDRQVADEVLRRFLEDDALLARLEG